jgi:diguanylate cyclase (GGDEF)-like protein
MLDPRIYDQPTGCFNRCEMERRVRAALIDAKTQSRRYVIAYFDIDEFGQVNATIGHRAGDRFLREVAAAMRHAIPHTASLGRIGGNEFALLLPDTSLAEGPQVAQSIARAVANGSYVEEGTTVSLTMSGGVAEVTWDSPSPVKIWAQLEEACGHAKIEPGTVRAVQQWVPTNPSEFDAILRAQAYSYDVALKQLRQGRKNRRWLGFMFPVLVQRDVDDAPPGERTDGLEKARTYLNHSVLGPRLIECAEVLEAQDPKLSAPDGDDIWEKISNRDLHASLTVLALAAGRESIFQRLLDRDFEGVPSARIADFLSPTLSRN